MKLNKRLMTRIITTLIYLTCITLICMATASFMMMINTRGHMLYGAVTPETLISINEDMSRERAVVLTTAINACSDKFDVPILDIVSVMVVESNGKNTWGDTGKSVGYFQMQMDTINDLYRWYSKSFTNLPKVKDTKDFLLSPVTQVIYCTLNLRYLYGRLEDRRSVFLAYNAGLWGYIDGRYTSDYWDKIQRARDMIKYIRKEESL